MNERTITSILLARLKKEDISSCAIEVKVSRAGSIPFSALKQHQKEALLHTCDSKIVFKIPDLGNQNPFDAFVLSKVPAYITLIFLAPGVRKTAYFIPVHEWIKKENESKRKSLTKNEAAQLSSFTLNL